MPLSDTEIRNAKPDPARKVRKLSDGGGLHLAVMPNGSRLWRLAYRFGGKQKLLSMGSYPDTSLVQARARREEARALLADGVDPSAHRKAAKAAAAIAGANTFLCVADELLAKKRREGRSAGTLAKNSWLLSFAASLHARPIAELKAPEILAVLREVEGRGLHETATRLRALIGQTFRYAIATGRADSDPTYSLRGALTVPQTKHYAAIVEPKEFGALLRAIDGYEGQPTTRIALQLLALVFCRPGELRQAAWSEFDLETAVWSIPLQRMKSRRPHRVPLSKQALALLEELRRCSGRYELLFPGVRVSARPLSENTLNAGLRRLGFSQDEMTSHGFRSTASSLLNESGLWSADSIERQLAHADPDEVRRAYHRADHWAERAKMMQWWSDRCDEMRRGAEVVTLRRA